MQNDGYQQAMNEIRVLRREREVYREALDRIRNSIYTKPFQVVAIDLCFSQTAAIHAEIPVHETVEVSAGKTSDVDQSLGPMGPCAKCGNRKLPRNPENICYDCVMEEKGMPRKWPVGAA